MTGTEVMKKETRKVLVIKPSIFVTTEEIKKLKESIRIDASGIIFIPNYCEYEFGEIESIVIKGSVNGL